MKVRDSGMPDEEMWDQFFDPSSILARLGLTPGTSSAVDLGCGYGSFTIPAARIVEGTVHGFDIEPEMIAATDAKARDAGMTNVELHLRDFVAEGTGHPGGTLTVQAVVAGSGRANIKQVLVDGRPYAEAMKR